MCNHYDGEVQVGMQVAYQFIEFRGGDRVQAGRGFIQKQDFRVQRQGPGQAGAFAHSTGQFRGVFAGGIHVQAGHEDFQYGQLTAHFE